jgi:predicted RNase H-like nuclease
MTGNSWRYVGVDWDSGAWIAVGYPGDGDASVAAFETIEELWTTHGESADRIVVDVPVGLCESRETESGCPETDGELSRPCDDLARQVLGSRWPSVFTAPCRVAAEKVVEGAEYSEVNETNRDRTGKGLMQQAANIAPGIVEVDDLLRNEGDSTVLVEGHPEVCFRAFAGGPLQYSKRTAPGMAERLTALEDNTEYEAGTWRRLAETLGQQGHDTGADDLLDALSLAITARAPESEFQQLPREPRDDGAGLPMQMVYRRDTPFAIE